jgi:hypothetical protein
MKDISRTVMLHVRIPQDLKTKLADLSAQRRIAVSKLVREILEYDVKNPAFLPRPGEPIAGQIRLLAKRLKMKPSDLIQGWIEEKLSEDAFEEDGVESDRVFSLEERFDLLLQQHQKLAKEIKRAYAALGTEFDESRSQSSQLKKSRGRMAINPTFPRSSRRETG